MSALSIAPGLALDPDYVGGGTFALLAKKGAGKSYTARVMAEEFWKAKIPFARLDPMGAGWGLRASADGKGEGIPVAIFGGAHGDAPLERGGGKLMADLLVDERLSMVLDMKDLGSRAAERHFARDFLERLYRRNSELVHLLIDEADLFAPQKPAAGDQPLLGVTENIVRRGRNVGIGVTLITQRPAVLNKDVLTQVDGLVAMRITGLQDRQAIDEWVKGHADQDAAREVKGTLSGLANGECWWWVPELEVLSKVQVRTAQTFDSSPTRKRGEARREPKTFADVDMSAIEQRMSDTIERAKAEDPKELRRRIAELERDLARRPEAEPERVEVPVLDESSMERIENWHTLVRGGIEAAQSALDAMSAHLAELVERTASHKTTATKAPGQPESHPPGAGRGQLSPAPPWPPRAVPPSGNGKVPPAQLRVLNAMAALEGIGVAVAPKVQLALFAGASPKSSAYTNNLGALRSGGYIDYPQGGYVALTDEGRALADTSQAPSSTAELHAYVRSLVGPTRGRIVDALISVYPDALGKRELAEAAGASPSSSAYTNNLGSLRSLGLIDYPSPGMVAAQDVLFIGGRA